MRRDYDTISPRKHPFVMVPSPEVHQNAHPFWYAAVLGVFHTEVQYMGSHSSDLRPKNIEFLWVRWLEPAYGYSFGRKHTNLPKLRFIPNSDEFSTGFLDPSRIVRGCHLIPAFADGKMNDFSVSHDLAEGSLVYDWKHYYVRM